MLYQFRKNVIGEAAEARSEKKADKKKCAALQQKVAYKKSMWDSVYALNSLSNVRDQTRLCKSYKFFPFYFIFHPLGQKRGYSPCTG